MELLGLIATPLAGQLARHQLPPADSSAVVWLRLADGTEMVGRVVEVNDTTLVMRTMTDRRVVVSRAAVRVWRTRLGGEAPLADAHGSRLFFGATGRTLPRGRGVVVDHYLFIVTVAHGVHDRVTLSAGGFFVFGSAGAFWYVGPKVGLIRSRMLNVAVGGLYWDLPGIGGSSSTTYAAVTLGPEDFAVSGMVFTGFDSDYAGNRPGIMVGGEARLGSRAKAIVEVWDVPGFVEIPSIVGLRLFSQRVTVSIGAASWRVPYFDVGYNW